MALYSCKHSGDQFRISKFDDDMNVQSSYLCTETECDCPAGVRPICRHREMLPKFIERKTVNTEWWFDYDRGGWVQMDPDWLAILSPNEILKDIPMKAGEGEGEMQVKVSDLPVTNWHKLEATLPSRPLPPAHSPTWRRIRSQHSSIQKHP